MESFRKEKVAGESREPLPMRLTNWARFVLGLFAVLALALTLAKGLTPPGAAGKVLKHNQKLNIDATPLYYTEVEDFEQLEQDLPQPSDG